MSVWYEMIMRNQPSCRIRQ